MRPFYLFFSFFCLLAIAGCGSEEELIPPAFVSITASGSLGSTTILTTPSQDPIVIISGNIDDFTATIVANSTVTGEVPVGVNSDSSWSFPFAPQEGANIVTFTASDARGNFNQMVLTVQHDMIAPLVTAVEQSADPSQQLIVTFNEAILDTSLTTALFSVVNPVDGAAFIDPSIATATTSSTVTLPLAAALPPGTYRLACPEVKDIATPNGNRVAAGYFFDFTIE